MTTKLENLHHARQAFKNTILKNKLRRLGLEESANLYIQPIIQEQEQNTDRIIAAIDKQNPEHNRKKIKEFENTFSIDFRNIDQNLSKSIRPVFGQDGFKIGAKFIEVDSSKQRMRVEGSRNEYQITQELVDLIKGLPIENYSALHLSDYYSLLNDVGASTRSKRFREFNTLLFKQGYGIQFLPDNDTELLTRLEKLLSAAKEGHSNVYNEGMAVLKRLLEKKVISMSEFKKYSKFFPSN